MQQLKNGLKNTLTIHPTHYYIAATTSQFLSGFNGWSFLLFFLNITLAKIPIDYK